MKASKGNTFALDHCWVLLEHCEKWRLKNKETPSRKEALIQMDDEEDDDGPRNKNKPDGNKKAKDKIKREAGAASLREKIDHMVKSNEALVIKTLEVKKEMVEKKAQEKQERWQLIKEEYLRKAAIEKRRAMDEENKAMAKLLQEENKIMMMNRHEMDELIKEWHVIARKEILERRRQAAAASVMDA